MKNLLSIFRLLMVATLINIVKDGAVQAALTAKDLPSWPSKHRYKFNLFEAEFTPAYSGKTPSCNLKITQEANSSFFKVIEKFTNNDLDGNNNNNNKELPKLQVFVSSDLPKSGSGTLIIAEFLKEFATSMKLKIDEFFDFSDDDKNTAKNSNNNKKFSSEELDQLHEKEKNRLLSQAAQDLFPQIENPPSSSSPFEIGPSVLLFHEPSNIAFLFVDLSSPISATGIHPMIASDGASRCYSHARSFLHLVPGNFRLQSIPYVLPQPTYEHLETESRAAFVLRKSLTQRGNGFITSTSTDIGYQHRKLINNYFAERQREAAENGMNPEQRVFSRNQARIQYEERTKRRLKDEILQLQGKSNSNNKYNNDNNDRSTNQDYENALQVQIAQMDLRADLRLQEMVGYPSGLILGVFSDFTTGKVEAPVDPFMKIPSKENCVEAGKRMDVNAARCKFFKGVRREYRGQILAGIHHYDDRCMLIQKAKNNNNDNNDNEHNPNHEESWLHYILSNPLFTSSSTSSSNSSARNCDSMHSSSTNFAHFVVTKIVSFGGNKIEQECHKDHYLNDVHTNVMMFHRVL